MLNNAEEKNKAAESFANAQAAAKSGNFEQAIDLYLAGLHLDPENVDAHRDLRLISFQRKAAGGKDLRLVDRVKLRFRRGNPKEAMLNAERLLAYDPGDMEKMIAVQNAAGVGGFVQTAEWMTDILLRTNQDRERLRL